MLPIFEKLDSHSRRGLCSIIEDYSGIRYEKMHREMTTMCKRLFIPGTILLIDAIANQEFELAQYIAELPEDNYLWVEPGRQYIELHVYDDLINNHPQLLRTLLLKGRMPLHNRYSHNASATSIMRHTKPCNSLRNALILYERYKKNGKNKDAFVECFESAFRCVEFEELVVYISQLDRDDILRMYKRFELRESSKVKDQRYESWLEWCATH